MECRHALVKKYLGINVEEPTKNNLIKSTRVMKKERKKELDVGTSASHEFFFYYIH